MPKRHGKRKKRRTHEEEVVAGPRSMVVRRGRTSKSVTELVADLRRVMAPNTAERLKERAKAPLKDYVSAAEPLGVTHLLLMSQHDEKVALRLARLPAGPTLTFSVRDFQLARRVKAEQRRPFDTTASYLTSPLLVLNNFSRDVPHVKLMKVTLEAMFPAIDVAKVKLADCRRVVLCQLQEDDTVELRHYAIRAKAAISKNLRRVVEGKPPDLSNLNDVADYLNETYESDSDVEAPAVVLPSDYVGKGNKAHRPSTIRLAELGPRLTLHLAIVHTAVGSTGDVLYRAHSKLQQPPAKKRKTEDSA